MASIEAGPRPSILPRGAEPFRIDISDDALEDLRRRLRATAMPIEPAAADWRYGPPVAYLRDLIGWWSDGYDWRAAEGQLNRFPQYRVPVTLADGSCLRIHVVVEIGSNPDLPPIVLSHGWPSLPFEFFGVIDAIAHPERSGGQAAHGATVIVPSLPGFGFSDPPPRPMHAREIAECWRRLMVDGFGCERFFAHGGDWGAVVSSWLAVDSPQVLSGLHLSMLGLRPALDPAQPLDDEEKRWVKDIQKRLARDGGYREQQATRPTTLGFGLADSPAFLAAWLVDKYHGWCGSAPDELPRHSQDTMLTFASLFWFSRSLPAASWIYYADRNSHHELAPGQLCEVPTGCSFFGNGFFPAPPTRWVERGHKLRFRQDFADGGHFPALLSPDEFVDSLHACYRHADFAT
jgi:pimeloyl-ACP methyl ester carboxylesterase